MRKVLILFIVMLFFAAYQSNGFIMATKQFNGRYSVYKQNEAIESEYDLSFNQALIERISGDISGQSVRFIGKDEDIDYLIRKLNIQVKDEQNFSNIRTIYGYSARLGEGVKLSGEKVNIQIARRGSTITVGTPLILGSY